MRSVGLLLMLATQAHADSYTEALTREARDHANAERCDLARRFAKLVEKRDPRYYRSVFVADPAIHRCLAADEHERRFADAYESWRASERARRPRVIRRRIGLDVMVSGGPIITAGGSVRYETGDRHRFVARVTALAGIALFVEGPGFAAYGAQIGYRAMEGRFYLDVELGGAAIYEPASYDSAGSPPEMPARFGLLPTGSIALGVKGAHVEGGVAGLFPFLGVGVYLGFDFAQL